jgi:hypothetical protein
VGHPLLQRADREDLRDLPAGDLPRHPSQLYEAAIEGLVLFLIRSGRTHRRSGQPPAADHRQLPAFLRACSGIAIENVRQPDRRAREPSAWGSPWACTCRSRWCWAGAFPDLAREGEPPAGRAAAANPNRPVMSLHDKLAAQIALDRGR